MTDGGHPNLNLTPEEKRVFYKLFQAADKTNLGVVTGEVAVSFFEKTSLPPETLGLIWQIADTQNRGLLTPSGFGVVMRLIGHAQAGRTPTEELALQPGPLPKFSGLSKDIMEPTPQAQPPVASSPPPGAGPVRVPPLVPEDVTKFTSLFERSEVQNGLLSGEHAKQIFERARLPNEVLGRIWNLADTKQRGALDATEFIIAMHLLSAYRNGAMRILPQTLPPGLYDAAARRGGVRTSTSSRSSSDIPPVPAIPKQFSGSGTQRAQSPLNRPPQFQSTIPTQSTGGDWVITPQEKAHFDTVFGTVDKANLGYITGDQAVEFFTNAQLPEETLASIWDLADIDSDGQLSKDEFAVAMYLVRQQRTTREPLPQILPPALIPPSMRRQVPPPAPAARIVPQNTAQRSAAEDLFGLDVFGPPVQVAQTTGGSNPALQPPSSPTQSPLSASATSTFKPFVPSSSFGQSLTPHTTGLSNAAPVQQRSPPPSADDLLADVDVEASKKVSQESVDLANLSNQIGSLSREMQNVQGKRAAAEQDLAQNSQQKKDFEARLAQARAMYEQEAKDFKALEDRLTASRAETKKLHQDFALIEASRQDLQNHYNQVNAALDADQRENASLKEQIRQANAQVSQLKPLLEKARSAARQQKGLVAINKKQLATVEGERDRIQGEIDSTTKEVDEVQRQASERASPASQPPSVASPAPSTASQTNPFFRRTASVSDNSFSPPPPSSSSQEPPKNPQSVFDNVFGPSFTVPSTSTPPPPTTFRTESPAQQTPLAAGPAKTSDTSGALTPSASPNSAEPPPPPQSRQISSSQLPIEGHQASEASSVRPSPPASRFGTSVASEPDTSSSAKSPFESEEPKPDTKLEKPSSDSDRSTSQTGQGSEVSNIPGSFPVESAQAAPTKKEATFDELFGGITHARSPSQKANDFEEAFAQMKVKNGGDSGFPEVAGGKSTEGASEFPPIRELDDDDDSTDSEAAKGFDDDFSPVSPPRQNEQVSRDISSPQPFAPPSSQSTSPPEMNGQGPSKENSQAEAPASNGLTHIGKDSAGASQPTLPGKKPTTPDFEAAFAGLELAPAKEADDDDEDDEDDNDFESPYNKDSSNFDMTFDSPGLPSKSSTIANATTGASSGNNTTNVDFFTFDNNQQQQLQQSSTPPPASGTAPQDWDALFSVLDSSKAAKSPKEENKPTSSEGGQPSSDSAALSSFPQPPGKGAKPPGWALSADTGEDDMILQRLTGMGYPRDESLAALEKFDYNLDKAADFLASKS